MSDSLSSDHSGASADEIVIPVRSNPVLNDKAEASGDKKAKGKKRRLAKAKPVARTAAGAKPAAPRSPAGITAAGPAGPKPAAPKSNVAQPAAARTTGPQATAQAAVQPTVQPVAQPRPLPASHAAAASGAAGPVSARPIPVAPGQGNAPPTDEDYDDDVEKFILSKAVPSWLVSMVVHAIVLLVLAMMLIKGPPEDKRFITASEPIEEVTVDKFEPPEPQQIDLDVKEIQIDTAVMEKIEDVKLPEVALEPELDVSPAPADPQIQNFADKITNKGDLLAKTTVTTGTGFAGRKGASRSAMAIRNGGSKQSEAAVAMALEWLAKHQNRDGSWSFDHGMGPCQGRCANPGSLRTSRMGATGMALLPFLGAGQTHKQGKYKRNVEAGLYYLTRNMKVAKGMGDMMDVGGRMYSHGLAAIALCEAYAMTKDRGLQGPAQLSINFICYAQDPVGGGWRYRPQQAGDTSVVGWQLMALKSAHLAYLKVPPEVVKKASKFLDSVQVNYGSQYGYTSPGARHSTSAIGLLCRMYLGWKRENPSLQQGVEILSGVGPSQDMYYNYYATQVMRHYGGKQWEKWNSQMRDWIVNSQDKNQHQKGSWFIGTDHGTRSGGRLYCTCLATMILEVYYRHMPIYGKQAAEDDFPF